MPAISNDGSAGFSKIHLEALYRLALAENNPQLTILMKKYKVGILGYGWAATAHADAINATGTGEIAAVCSSRKLDEAELSARHGSAIKAYRKLEDMLADDEIDVIDVTGYPNKHAPQVIKAAEAWYNMGRAHHQLGIEQLAQHGYSRCLALLEEVEKALRDSEKVLESGGALQFHESY